MMNGKEKLYFLLEKIEDIKELSPSGDPLVIDSTNDLNGRYTDDELSRLFTKLEKDEKILKVIQTPSRIKTIDIVEDLDIYGQTLGHNDGYWHIELLPEYTNYYLKIQNQPEYQEFTGKTPKAPNRMPLSRKSLEKIWDVLQEIETKRGITNIGDDISIQQVHWTKVGDNIVSARNAADERLNILRKLEAEDHAVKDIRFPTKLEEYIYLKLGDDYWEILNKYKEEYEKSAKDYQFTKDVEVSPENYTYKVSYSEQSRKIMINNFLIKRLRSFGDNDAIFSYLYKNPKQDKTDKDIRTATGLDTIKDLNKFIENIGFKGDLRKVFFKVSKDKIRFNNPITKEDMKELGIEYLKLE